MIRRDWHWATVEHLAADSEQAGQTVSWLLLWAPLWNRQLEQHAYPGQPTHQAHDPIRPCRCWYLCLVCGLDLTYAWCAQDVDLTWCYHPASGVPHRATGFIINPGCPHHGDH